MRKHFPLLLLLLLPLFVPAQDKKYHFECTFLEIVMNGDSVEYGKGNTLAFDTDSKTDVRTIDTIRNTIIGIQFELAKENGLIVAGFTLYRIIDGKWDAFAQYAPVEPGTVKPYTQYVSGKPSIKNTDFINLPDPPFQARFATAVYYR